MNDQQFVNAYIRILNDTLTDAFSKNLVMQAQLESAKQSSGRIAELEAKIKELTDLSSDNNALLAQLSNVRSQLDHANNQANAKNAHLETFKRELLEARAQVKNAEAENLKVVAALNANAETLKAELAEARTQLRNVEDDRSKVVSALNAEIELLKAEVEELKSKKKKNLKALNNSTLENSILISDDSTF